MLCGRTCIWIFLLLCAGSQYNESAFTENRLNWLIRGSNCEICATREVAARQLLIASMS